MSALDIPLPPAVPLVSERVAAVVLAGGEARRMGGGDKPLLSVGRQTMLAAVIQALDIPHTAISANGDPLRFAAFGRPVLSDGAQGQGPLAGVLAGLEWAASLGMTALLTAPGDTPFLPRGLAAMLSPPPCAVRHGGQTHHLIALWPVSCRENLTAFLRAGSRRAKDFAAEIGMRSVDFPLRPADPFANINTPEELAWAREVVSSTGNL